LVSRKGTWPAGSGAPRAYEQDQGVHLLDGGQAPIVVAGNLLGVEGGRVLLDLFPGHLVGHVDHAVAVGVGRLLPHEAGDVVGDGETVGARGVVGLVALVLGVLAVEVRAGSRRGDLAGSVVAGSLA
jgi:hypothetical protein